MSDGIRINGKMISAAVGLVTLLLALVGGLSFVIKQDYRISGLETKVVEMASEMKEANEATKLSYDKILEKFDKLTNEVTKLTISLNQLEVKQDLAPDKK